LDATISSSRSLLSLTNEERQLDTTGKQETQLMIFKGTKNSIIWMILMILKRDSNQEITIIWYKRNAKMISLILIKKRV